ncbi:MAG: hypothetical protein ACR2L9_04565 [Solirubrobacteraceae bacterium]
MDSTSIGVVDKTVVVLPTPEEDGLTRGFADAAIDVSPTLKVE